MRITKRYTDNLEELNNSIYHVDSYAPNMGDFNLDISTFMKAKMDVILNKNQKYLKTHLTLEKSSQSGKTLMRESHNYIRNYN
jgi:hypothetical protein